MHKDRRDFIQKVTAAALVGSVAPNVLADQSLAPVDIQTWRNSMKNRGEQEEEILILGAGISGLCAAYELAKQGVKYKILEARSRPGGRNETIRHGSVIEEFDRTSICDFSADRNLYFNVGPARISTQHKRVLSYCNEFSIPLEPLINDNRNTYFSFSPSHSLKSREVYASQRGLIASTLAKAIDQNLTSHLIPNNQNQHMLEMLKSFGELDDNFNFTSSTRAGVAQDSGTFTPEQGIEPTHFEELLQYIDKWKNRIHFEQSLHQQSVMLQPKGGMDKIVKGFTSRLPGNIRYNSKVLAIKRSTDGAEVTYENKHGRIKTITAEKVIVTLPLTVLQDIEHDFSNEISQEIQQAQYSSAGKIAFQSKRFWETNEQIFGGISWLDTDNAQIWYPSAKFGSDLGILVGGYIFGGPAGDRFAQLSEYQRISDAISQMSLVHPNTSDHVYAPVSRSWKNTPYSKGGWSSRPPIEAFSHCDGPYVFSGDHTTYLSGWQEGAIASAHRALELLDL
ncbi:flavin monoamine oxidase family protein [Pseudoalteromonas umbrosa]|uniref:flavin monoamine oxidase family protein n=1 Tax=Pseudoalteromonas umbrosa TaxID=3048489 RepID=UPI0024C40CE2|nr:FAD-dependent oxidoreductase [Pseudoalteromonas sp. B95]MDK1286208.1 FAD-dependent oxidoreductase [Pseudoalteromonas sp. B95]